MRHHLLALAALTCCAHAARADSLFSIQTPALPIATTGTAYELGTRWTASEPGFVRALRFWKSVDEGNAVHVGRLWQGSTILATVTFTGETADGWQQATLPTPIAVQAGVEMLVTVNTGNKAYVVTRGDFSVPLALGVLSVPLNGGVYGIVCGSNCQRPSFSGLGSNYFRDVVFATAAPGPTPAPCQCPPVTTTGQAVLGWTPPSVVGTGYRVYYGNSPGVYSQPYGSGILVPSGGSTTYTATGLQSGKNYCFVVTTVDTRTIPGESVYSNEACKVIN